MRNLKKVIALVAVFAMIISSLSVVAFASSFDDVVDTDTYSAAIETLNQLGILTGDDENNDGVMSFRPNDTITRAEITAILARMKGQTGAVAQTNTIFTDVPATHWASGYIASATNQGIINGYGDGTFGPDDNVQYQDVIKMVMENLGYKNYALDNGGYPTGYELAASRYGVTTGVVGGADGTESTRGQVAQIVANAIEAPLMDRLAYGGNGQYVIYDGTWQPLKTCLDQYLGVVKMRGNVISNRVTNLSGPLSLATNRNETVRIKITDLFKAESTTYDYAEGGYEFYVGSTNAADYFGYDVTFYVRSASADNGTIISITPTEGQNTTVSFTLDQYSYLDDTLNREAIYYKRNENDRSATRLPIDSNVRPYVIYNGICGYTLENIFAPQADPNNYGKYMVAGNSPYSGQVTMIDNNSTAGYDYIFVDIAESGVVQELSTRGQLSFKNSIGSQLRDNRVSRIDFSNTASDAYINITKDGQPYDYTQLKEWDVLSIIANTKNTEYYRIEVLDGTNTAIAGTVSREVGSDTSFNQKAFTIGDTTYDVAYDAFNASQIRPGSTGTFYIDKYGKIVAYNRDLNAQGGTSDNYAYILDAKMGSATFGSDVPVLQFIYKDGTLATAQFAATVGVYNPTPAFRNGDTSIDDADYVSYQYKNDTDVNSTVEALVGQVVTLNASNGMIRSITLPLDQSRLASTNVDEDQTLYQATDAAAYDYDQDDGAITIGNTGSTSNSLDVTADTLVFFIGEPNDDFHFGEPSNGNAVENCTVANGTALATMKGNQAVAYTNGNSEGYADVLVLYNSNIATSPSTGVAFVTSVGTSANNTLDVQYYQDGELKSAVTSENYTGPLTESTQPGSLFKFGMSNGQITSAQSYLTFKDNTDIRSDVNSDSKGVPQIKELITPQDPDEKVYFGAVVAVNGTRITIAPLDESGIPSIDPVQRVQLGSMTANYYLYDASRSPRSRCGIGARGDIYVDPMLAGDAGQSTGETIVYGSFRETNPVWGMLDYVFVRDYQRTGDVVIYMQRQYPYTVE